MSGVSTITSEAVTLTTLAGGVLLLGLKHGFDADHLAAIDAASRLHRQAGRIRSARWCGIQFSAGHGLVVLGAALLAFWAGGVLLPDWLDATGAWVSISLLTLIGLLSIRSAHQTGLPETRGARWLGPMMNVLVSRWGPATTGGLFALSLDTLSMAAWMGGAGARWGLPMVMLLAVLFGLGMVLADGVCGWWVNRLASQPELTRARGQRIAAWAIGLGALGTAAVGVARRVGAWPEEGVWSQALPLGLSLLAVTSLVLLLAVPISRRLRG